MEQKFWRAWKRYCKCGNAVISDNSCYIIAGEKGYHSNSVDWTNAWIIIYDKTYGYNGRGNGYVFYYPLIVIVI